MVDHPSLHGGAPFKKEALTQLLTVLENRGDEFLIGNIAQSNSAHSKKTVPLSIMAHQFEITLDEEYQILAWPRAGQVDASITAHYSSKADSSLSAITMAVRIPKSEFDRLPNQYKNLHAVDSKGGPTALFNRLMKKAGLHINANAHFMEAAVREGIGNPDIEAPTNYLSPRRDYWELTDGEKTAVRSAAKSKDGKGPDFDERAKKINLAPNEARIIDFPSPTNTDPNNAYVKFNYAMYFHPDAKEKLTDAVRSMLTEMETSKAR